MHKENVIKADTLEMRLVQERDAEFIVAIRTDNKLGKYISHTPTDIHAQINWIRDYKKLEINNKEFYFIFKDENNTDWGTIRIYNITNDSFTLGSWICLPGNKDNIALKAWFLSIDYAFQELGKEYCFLDVRKKNRPVYYFLNLFQPTLINETHLDYYLKLKKDTYFKRREKILDLLKIKL